MLTHGFVCLLWAILLLLVANFENSARAAAWAMHQAIIQADTFKNIGFCGLRKRVYDDLPTII